MSLPSLLLHLSVLYNTHNTHTHTLSGIFLISLILCFVLHPYFFHCLECPAFYLLSLLTTGNTNIHASGGIQTLNPSKRLAADPRLRLLGQWDRRGIRTHNPSKRAVTNLRLKPRCHLDRLYSIPGPSSPKRIAIQNALSWPGISCILSKTLHYYWLFLS